MLSVARPSALAFRSVGLSKRRLATAVQPLANLDIPVIDFSKFLKSRSSGERQDTADQIVTAFKEYGFIYLKSHGIPASTVQNAFAKNTQFFALPNEIKDSLAWEDPRANRGYVTIGRERVTQSADANEIASLRAAAPDVKETMEIGRDWDSEWRNQWPQESHAPGFKQTMLDFYQTCHDLHFMVMRSIGMGLDLGEHFFDNLVHDQCHNLRLLSYPPVKRNLVDGDGRARAGAHTDYGSLTLLFQDDVGGLEVQNPHTKLFHPAPPIPETIVVNVGDLLARWSNDIFRSTLHRVVAPPQKGIINGESMTPHRRSIAFFCNPNFGARIECLPNCYRTGNPPKYPPVNAGEYIVGRLAATIQY